jgi:hypothetical protein
LGDDDVRVNLQPLASVDSDVGAQDLPYRLALVLAAMPALIR